MRILEFTQQPVTEIRYLNAGRGAGNFYEDRLAVHRGVVDRLPAGLDALLVTADLQGRERFQDRKAKDEPLRLLGEVLPERLMTEFLPEWGVPPDAKIGVLLAGDFYTVPALDRRGGSGDVTSVWTAFANEFAWVAGVAGNHDLFGENITPTRSFTARRDMHYLDGHTCNLGDMTIAGVGGIIGNPKRPHRRFEDDYLLAIMEVLERRPDILILHDGPDAPSVKGRGSSRVRELLEQSSLKLVIRGHSHWNTPFVNLTDRLQVLNVDARLVLLQCQC